MLVVEPGGERKQATVLFADIVGSTQMIAGMDAEGAMDRLQPVVAAMARAVRRYDGTILRTLGDGLKAAFGAPIAREGHALLATQAALAMREAVASLPDAPPIRIGLHSGEVVAGALDTGSTVELEAQGMTVHLANRIEQFAAPGEILLSGDCRALIGAYCETESLGSRAVRGIHAPIDVYRLVGLRPAVASDHFRGNELARFRGRDTELTLLKEALLAAENGTASVIGISAPAGLGKSRLCFEFGEWCRLRRVDVVEGRRLPEARGYLETILKTKPHDAVALNNLAWVYQQMNDPRAQSLARQAYILAPGAQTADTLGWILTGSGNSEAGVNLLRQASAEAASDPRVLYHFAVALKNTGKKDQAIKVLTEVVANKAQFKEKADAEQLLESLKKGS